MQVEPKFKLGSGAMDFLQQGEGDKPWCVPPPIYIESVSTRNKTKIKAKINSLVGTSEAKQVILKIAFKCLKQH